MLVNVGTGKLHRKKPGEFIEPSPVASPMIQREVFKNETDEEDNVKLDFDDKKELFSDSKPSETAKSDDGLYPLETTIGEDGKPFVAWNKSNFIAETKNLAQLTGPLWLTNLASFSAGFINTILVGRLGKTALGAAALSNMYCVMTGLSLGFGLLSASDTLCSQAFGAKNMSRVGLIFQRSVVVMLALCVPVFCAWMFSTEILLGIKQDPEIARLVGEYTRTAFFGFPFVVIFDALKRYLQAQSITSPPMWVSLVCGGLSLPIGWFYIFFMELARLNQGAALSVATNWFLQGALLSAYTYWRKLHVDTWPTINVSEILKFDGLKEYLALGVPGMFMSCAEWWGFEGYALMAGWISQTALAAQTALMTTSTILYMIPLSLAIATAILVGNRVGAGRWQDAVFSWKTATLITTLIAVVCSIALLSVRNLWGYVFTDDVEVLEVIARTVPFLCWFLLGDTLQGTLGGALRGSGRQKWGAAINIVSYYAIGMPVAASLAFAAKWGIAGLWTGFSLGSWIVVSLYALLMTRFSNWEEIAKEAQANANGQVVTGH